MFLMDTRKIISIVYAMGRAPITKRMKKEQATKLFSNIVFVLILPKLSL